MSFFELLIITIVALLVVGPKQLPTVARTVGRLFGKLHQFSETIKEQLHQQQLLAELEDNIKRAEKAETEQEKQ